MDFKDVEGAIQKKKMEMRNMSEEELEKAYLIKEMEIKKVFVKHAFCEDCGEELISNAPPMFNPFTLERICKHTCSKCGKDYNLEYAYPRLVFVDINGKEVPAYTR